MTTYYADSSALVKRYVNEIGSAWIRARCDPSAGHILSLVDVGLVEVAAALGVKVRQGLLSSTARDGLLRDLQRDGQIHYWLITVDHPLINRAISLTRQHKLRGYDAIHLAAALFLRDTLCDHDLAAPVMLTADLELLEAAQAEALVVENPNDYT
jgi:hypothetical protein